MDLSNISLPIMVACIVCAVGAMVGVRIYILFKK